MFCPNCGVEIHSEGSFCAKCRKNIAYLTQKEKADTVPASAPAAVSATTEAPTDSTSPLDQLNESPIAEPAVAPTPKQEKAGFFCNYCGTFVYPEDNYCYDCGKKTRKNYYKSSSVKKSFFSLGK